MTNMKLNNYDTASITTKLLPICKQQVINQIN